MPDRQWPIDAIGNPIRKGDLLRVTLPEPGMLFTVAEVEPAGMLSSPNGEPLSLQGTMMLVAQVPVPFSGGQHAANMLVLKRPEDPAIKPQ